MLTARPNGHSGTEEGFVFNIVVGEEERDFSALLTGEAVQSLQVLQKVTAAVRPAAQKKKSNQDEPRRGNILVFVIRPGQCDLEHLVSRDEGRQPRQALLPRPPDPDQQGVSLRRTQDPRDPHQVGHRVLPSDQTGTEKWSNQSKVSVPHHSF